MSLSQKQFHDFKKVCEEFYEPTEDLNEELFDDICDELIDELIEEGYSEEDAVLMIEDAANDYIDEAKVTFGHDTQAKRASGAPVGARRRFAMRKAGDAMKKAGDAVKGAADRAVGTAKAAKAGVEIAGTIAKDEVERQHTVPLRQQMPLRVLLVRQGIRQRKASKDSLSVRQRRS